MLRQDEDYIIIIMLDRYGREISYLRISVTDLCNLRCIYCMPPEGICRLSHDEIMTFEEIGKATKCLSELGIRRVRLTGGEPLVRRGIPKLIRMLADTPGIEEVCMTTNGILLAKYAKELKASGLQAVNVSLDTLDRDKFEAITGGGDPGDVLRGIDAALEAGIKVKLNCVPIRRRIGPEDIIKICEYASERHIDLRFIELMPLGEGRSHEGISADDIREILIQEFGRPENGDKSEEGSGPAGYYSYPGLNARIGFISPISHSFCDFCNRIRLTSDGILKLCLNRASDISVRDAIRGGISDEELTDMLREAIYNKPLSGGFGYETADPESRRMVQIGG